MATSSQHRHSLDDDDSSSKIFRVCQSNPTDKNEKEEGRKGRKERATERDLLRRLCVVSFLLLIVVAIVIRLLAY